jgi:16S rRNA (cytidine1402-2'-O)-methyltransferase
VAKPETKSESAPPGGRLSVVATPIGNLGDLSARAREVLAACDAIAAEDTRNTRNLLRHFGIDRPLVSLHEHNEAERARDLVGRMQAGAHIALVSDAGTPAISDPGYLLVKEAGEAGIDIVAIPGPCAAIAALSIAGLPTDRFCFEGFLPSESGARRTRLAALAGEMRTLVFYEAPHRIAQTLQACVQAFGAERVAVVAREITKRFETLYRGSLGQLLLEAGSAPDFSRGEIVLIVAGAQPSADSGEKTAELDRVLKILLAELPVKQAAHLAAKLVNARNNECYKRALQLKGTGHKDMD